MRHANDRGLERSGVNLSRLIIALSPEDTKERHREGIPSHRGLPILEEALHESTTSRILPFEVISLGHASC
jgi:hypothetical protein